MLFILLISQEEFGKGHHSSQASKGLKWGPGAGSQGLNLGLVAPSHHISLSHWKDLSVVLSLSLKIS